MKKQELVKPIQEKVYNAVQKLATEKMYDFVLDKSEGITVIFADPKLDKSDDVLKILGVKLWSIIIFFYLFFSSFSLSSPP